MPAKSKAQANLMRAAAHGAQFPMARKLRQSMPHQELHDFASGSEKGKPVHVQAHGRKSPTKPTRTDSHPGMRYR